MKPISEHLATSFIVSAFAHPHLFATPNDNGRVGRAVYRNTQALLTADVDGAEIDECNMLLIHFKNGGMYKSGDVIGIAANSCRMLEAVLDSGVTLRVRRNDGASMLLNDCTEYAEVTAVADVTEIDESL